MKTITLQKAKDLYQFCKGENIKMRESEFYFLNENDSIHPKWELHSIKNNINKAPEIYGYPAYNANELLEWLVEGLKEKNIKECLTCKTLKKSSPTKNGDEICPNCGDMEMMDLE